VPAPAAIRYHAARWARARRSPQSGTKERFPEASRGLKRSKVESRVSKRKRPQLDSEGERAQSQNAPPRARRGAVDGVFQNSDIRGCGEGSKSPVWSKRTDSCRRGGRAPYVRVGPWENANSQSVDLILAIIFCTKIIIVIFLFYGPFLGGYYE
jgi:hypothetical protein